MNVDERDEICCVVAKDIWNTLMSEDITNRDRVGILEGLKHNIMVKIMENMLRDLDDQYKY